MTTVPTTRKPLFIFVGYLAGLLFLWVIGLGTIGGAVGTAIKGAHPGALLAIPAAAAGALCFAGHAIILTMRRLRQSSNNALEADASEDVARPSP